MSAIWISVVEGNYFRFTFLDDVFPGDCTRVFVLWRSLTLSVCRVILCECAVATGVRAWNFIGLITTADGCWLAAAAAADVIVVDDGDQCNTHRRV